MMRTIAFASMIAALMSGTALAQGATPAADDGKRVATAVFAQLPNLQDARLSPDGGKIAYKLAANGNEALAVLDLTQPNPRPMVIASAGEFKEIGDRTFGSFRFVGNDNVVVTLISREDAFGGRGDLSRLFAYNLKTKKQTPLAWDGAFGAAADILHIDHKNAAILLQRQSNKYGTERLGSPEVVTVDVATGKYSTVMRPNPTIDSWFADGKGVIRGGTGGDSRSGEQRLIYRSGDGDTMQTIQKIVDKDFVQAGVQPVIFLDEPDMAIVTSNKDGYRKVYKTNMKTLELGKPLFERSGYDAGGVMSNEDRNKVLGFAALEERNRYYWTDPEHKQIQDYLDKGFGRGNARLLDNDLEYKRYLVGVAAPNQAGALYLYDVEKGDFNLLGYGNVALQNRSLNPVSTIRYRASDGEMVPAVLTMPRHRTGKKLPVVVITHGGPFGVRDAEDYDHWSQAMAELGYVVVQPNYRGSSGYGSEWVKKGRSNGFGLRMQDDLNEAVAHLAAQGVVDSNRACMMGWSYGGYASARAAQRDPDKWRCTIAGAGVYDLPAMKTYDVNYLGTFGSAYLAKSAADLKSVSPSHNTDGRWSPILIVHGVRDQRVPINQARGLVSRLKGSGKKQGVDFDYIEQPKNTHNLPYNDVRVEWLEGAEKWLAKHNPAYTPGDTDQPVPVGVTLKTAAN